MVGLRTAFAVALGLWLLLRGIVLPLLSQSWRGPTARLAKDAILKLIVDLKRADQFALLVFFAVLLSIGAGWLFNSAKPFEELYTHAASSKGFFDGLHERVDWFWIPYLLLVTILVFFDRGPRQADSRTATVGAPKTSVNELTEEFIFSDLLQRTFENPSRLRQLLKTDPSPEPTSSAPRWAFLRQFRDLIVSRGLHSSLVSVRSLLSGACSLLFFFSLIGFASVPLREAVGAGMVWLDDLEVKLSPKGVDASYLRHLHALSNDDRAAVKRLAKRLELYVAYAIDNRIREEQKTVETQKKAREGDEGSQAPETLFGKRAAIALSKLAEQASKHNEQASDTWSRLKESFKEPTNTETRAKDWENEVLHYAALGKVLEAVGETLVEKLNEMIANKLDFQAFLAWVREAKFFSPKVNELLARYIGERRKPPAEQPPVGNEETSVKHPEPKGEPIGRPGFTREPNRTLENRMEGADHPETRPEDR